MKRKMRKLKKVLLWISLTNLKLFNLLLKLRHQTLLVLQFGLKLTRLKVFPSVDMDRDRQRQEDTE